MGKCFSKRDDPQCSYEGIASLPPKPYLLFYLDVFKELSPTNDVASIAIEASKRWNQMTVQSLEPYVKAAEMIEENNFDFKKFTSQFGENSKAIEEMFSRNCLLNPKRNIASIATGLAQKKDSKILISSSVDRSIRKGSSSKIKNSADKWTRGRKSFGFSVSAQKLVKPKQRKNSLKSLFIASDKKQTFGKGKNISQDNSSQDQRVRKIPPSCLKAKVSNGKDSREKNLCAEQNNYERGSFTMTTRSMNRKIKGSDMEAKRKSRGHGNAKGLETDVRRTKSSLHQSAGHSENPKQGSIEVSLPDTKSSDCVILKESTKRKYSINNDQNITKKRTILTKKAKQKFEPSLKSMSSSKKRKEATQSGKKSNLGKLVLNDSSNEGNVALDEKVEWMLNWIEWLKHCKHLQNDSLFRCRKRSRSLSPGCRLRTTKAKKQRTSVVKHKLITCTNPCCDKIPNCSSGCSVSSTSSPIKPSSQATSTQSDASQCDVTPIDYASSSQLPEAEEANASETSSESTVLRFINSQFPSRSQSSTKGKRKKSGFVVNKSKRRWNVPGKRRKKQKGSKTDLPKKKFVCGGYGDNSVVILSKKRGKMCKKPQSETNFND